MDRLDVIEQYEADPMLFHIRRHSQNHGLHIRTGLLFREVQFDQIREVAWK